MRKRSVCVAAVAILAGQPVVASAQTVPDAEASYLFEANFDDSSGNGNHASLTEGTVTFTLNTGQLSPTLAGLWPTDDSQVDFLTVSNGELGNIGPDPAASTRALTVAFWVKLNDATETGHASQYWVIDKLNPAAAPDGMKGWGCYIEMGSTHVNGRPYFAFYDDEQDPGSYKTYVRGDNVIDFGEWWHLGVVYKFDSAGVGGGYTSWARWYMNGVGDDSYPNYDKMWTDTIPVEIGTETGRYSRNMCGVIDHLQIWHEALSDAQMMEVYEAARSALSFWPDADRDGDVDQADFAVLQACYTGQDPETGVSGACQVFDREPQGAPDGDVDVWDFEAFENCATGPGIALDPESLPTDCRP